MSNLRRYRTSTDLNYKNKYKRAIKRGAIN